MKKLNLLTLITVLMLCFSSLAPASPGRLWTSSISAVKPISQDIVAKLNATASKLAGLINSYNAKPAAVGQVNQEHFVDKLEATADDLSLALDAFNDEVYALYDDLTLEEQNLVLDAYVALNTLLAQLVGETSSPDELSKVADTLNAVFVDNIDFYDYLYIRTYQHLP